jgi:urease accessory protein
MPAATEPPPPVAFAGHLHLAAEVDAGGRTILRHQSFRAPFHVGKGYWDGRVLQVRVINPTAGILEGDRLELAVRAGPGAALLVTTPAATRAFMMKSGIATCEQRFAVEAGGWLEYAPEPLFPHRASDYTQMTHLAVALGGELYYVDSLAPGRVGLGECWAWRRLRIGLDAAAEGSLFLRERLDCRGDELQRLAAFHGSAEAWFGTVVMVSPRLAPEAGLWDRIRALHQPGCRIAPTRLRASSWIVRVVADSSLQLRDALEALRALCATALPRLASDLRRV